MKVKIKITKDVLKRSMLCGIGDKDWDCSEAKSFLQRIGVGFNCAIGVAINDLLPNAWVSPTVIRFFDSHKDMRDGLEKYNIELPSAAVSFIKQFDHMRSNPDQRLTLPEFDFEIDIPEAIINEIGIGEAYRILSESKTLELVTP